MANRYWVGGTGSWDQTSHWSASSGGSSGASVPSSSDAVIFDANSNTSGTFLVTVGVSGTANYYGECSSFDASGLDAGMTLKLGVSSTYKGRVIVHGNVTLDNSLSISSNFVDYGNFIIYGTSNLTYNGCITNSAGITLGDGDTNTAVVTLQDDFRSGFLYVNPGSTFNMGSNDMDLTGDEDGICLYATFGSAISDGGFTNTIDCGYMGVAIYDASSISMANTTFEHIGSGPLSGFRGGAGTYKKVSFGPPAVNNQAYYLYDSNTIGELELTGGLATGVKLFIENGSTNTVTTFDVNGTSGNNITLRSVSSGSRHIISKSSGTVTASNLTIQDSQVQGGATWIASNSVNSGNNLGWTFTSAPVANFTASDTTPYNSQSVSFTDTSTLSPTSWSWTFGDGNTSTLQNPTHIYTSDGTYTVSLTATNSDGSDTETKSNYITVTTQVGNLDAISITSGTGEASLSSESASYSLESVVNGEGVAIATTVFQPIPQKDYEVRVFDSDYNYIATYPAISNDPSWTENINQNPTELTIEIPRTPDNVTLTVEPLTDSLGDLVTDTLGAQVYVPSLTRNVVGEGTDINNNLYIDLYVFYGGYENLLDTNDEIVLDTDGEPVTVQYGYPNGKRVYSGYTLEYNLAFGTKRGVTITVIPHSTRMLHRMFKTVGGDTTIPYNSVDPVQMARDAMDRDIAEGGLITYTTTSMPLTGEVASYDFKLQRTREVIDKSIDLLPVGYYSRVDIGERVQYILEKATEAHHTFYYEQHISDLDLKRSMSQLINQVYFVGGEYDPIGHPGESLLKFYEDVDSVLEYGPGLEILSDSRVTLALSAQALSQSKINDFKEPRYRTKITITDAVYDIETIKVGQMVAFKNFDSFIDGLLLQIVTLQRFKHKVVLTLDTNIPSDGKRMEDIKRRLGSTEVAAIPDAPV